MKLKNKIKLKFTNDINKKMEVLKEELYTQLGYEWVEVPQNIINKYRNTTKKGMKYTDDEIEYKINREIYSGSTFMEGKNVISVGYGNMNIMYHIDDNKIYYISNSKTNKHGHVNAENKKQFKRIYLEVFN